MSKSFSKNLHIDLHTFGNTKACEILAEMMNQGVVSVYNRNKTLSFLNKVSSVFHSIIQISKTLIKRSSPVNCKGKKT